MATRSAFSIAQYGWVVVWTLVVGLISHFADESPAQLTALKVGMVPVIAVASYALEHLFDFEDAYQRWTPAFIERVLVTAFVLSASVTFLIARPESSMAFIAWTFVWMFLVFAAISIFGPLSNRRRREIAEAAKEKGGS